MRRHIPLLFQIALCAAAILTAVAAPEPPGSVPAAALRAAPESSPLLILSPLRLAIVAVLIAGLVVQRLAGRRSWR